MLLLLSHAFAADPTMTARWAAGEVQLQVVPPAGEHVNVEAPGSMSLGPSEVHGLGALEWARLPVPEEGGTLHAELPFCTDSGSNCRLVAMEAVIGGNRRSGKATLTAPALVVPAAPAGSIGAAVRLYDFGAVWCPPCNQMKAEFLDDASRMAAWSVLEIVPVDVDRPESWPLKSRYHVGGYPTLVAVDASGAELDRYVGYEGVASLEGWFAGLSRATPLAAMEAGPPAGVAPAEAGRVALRLAKTQREELAQRWLKAAGDSRDAHYARLLLAPDRTDAMWLIAHDAQSDWVPDLLGAFPDLFPAVAPRIPELSPELATWAFDAYAAKATPDAALVAHAAFTTLTQQHVTDNLGASRGYVVDLADGYASLGDLPRALAVLDTFKAAYSQEFTWDFAASRLLADAKKYPESEARARAALAVAWGDQRLRAVQRLARAVDAQGRRPEALAVLKTELAAAPTPTAADAVRTTRYRAEVEAMIKEFGG